MSGENTKRNTGLKPPWKPGESGNPGGRPKKLAKRVRERISEDDLIDFQLAVLTLDGESLERWQITGKEVRLADRQEAHKWLTERGHGRAASLPTVEDGDPLELGDVERTIADLVDELASKREAKAPGPAENGKVAAPGSTGATSA